jgi:hypothetical protein
MNEKIVQTKTVTISGVIFLLTDDVAFVDPLEVEAASQPLRPLSETGGGGVVLTLKFIQKKIFLRKKGKSFYRSFLTPHRRRRPPLDVPMVMDLLAATARRRPRLHRE